MFKRNEIRENLGCRIDEAMLISVGELSVRKNHRVVIEALKELADYDFRYYIIGQGELKEELEKLADEYGLKDKVYLLGFRTDVNELLEAADLFVFPSLQEGLPVALMEAIANGKTCICSRIRGNTDLIKDEEYLFEPGDIKRLRKMLERQMTTENSGETNRKMMNFSTERVKEAMTVIYKAV